MKKVAVAAAFAAFASSAYAGGKYEVEIIEVEPEVVVEEAASSSSAGLVVLLLLAAVIAAASSN